MSKCIRKHEHLSTRGQCVDCGKPAHKIIQELQQENEALRNEAAKGVHTCHANCPRPMCVLTRENEALKADRDSILRACAHAEESGGKSITTDYLRKRLAP